ncbi:alpha-glucuronidase family glycosyl hydrolase [Balneolaceae bacterium ANBcel3]|nr:alpha-glucuronidase family glycosyl hydrolase [Balneolaceae bacterium ANBcel3]
MLAPSSFAEDGYRMWLRYDKVNDNELRQSYKDQLQHLVLETSSETMSATKSELKMGLGGLLDRPIEVCSGINSDGALVAGTPSNSQIISSLELEDALKEVGPEGFLIRRMDHSGNKLTVIAANEDIGVLYGAFHLLRELQTEQSIESIDVKSAPRVRHRTVNHWDNLDRLVERGYAGLSLWEWGTLPDYKHPRYTDYARFNASLGINGTAINNVNANPEILTDQFLEKVAVLADIFRPYGIQVYLSVFFDSPVVLGGLDTADPLDPEVQEFWNEITDKVYSYIPDFGGYLVKADSEGQPGPHGYGRDHADGANVLARALEPHGGLVIWRAFVYDPEQEDRFREAYDEFLPLDGRFMDNVTVQVKNGPIDFQPREPFSPLFGALPNTNTILELQITQEYFGFNFHLAYKGTYYEEVLRDDTRVKGEGTTVGRIIAGEVFDYEHTGMAGVINPGTDRNWTGHPFVQSSWYAYGRMAWDYTLGAEELAEEWIRMTFSNDEKVIEPMKEIMMESKEAGVNYRSPLGLTHLYAQGHHYGPAPWTADLPRADWTAVYYHQATEWGIGYDRTETGSNAVEQFHPEVAAVFGDLNKIPDDYLLWFHHVPWDHPMNSGRILWDELVHKYYKGVETVRWMQETWDSLEGLIDQERFEHVKALLSIQERDAVRWRNSCVLYFQSFSGMPIPEEYEQPEHDLQHYIELENIIHVPDPWYN